MAVPWTGPSAGPRSQQEPTARTGSSGRDQVGKKAGPLDWSIRGAADRRYMHKDNAIHDFAFSEVAVQT